MEGIEEFLKTVAKSALPFPYIWRAKSKPHNQKNRIALLCKKFFSKKFGERGIFAPIILH